MVDMKQVRMLSTQKEKTWKSMLLKWEVLLALILIAVCLGLKITAPNIVSFSALVDNTMVFINQGFVLLSMLTILVIGEIDISVGSVACLSSVVMAYVYKQGVPFALALVIALVVGVLCGLINGLIITRFKELAPMIVTLATMTIYRGIAYMILGQKSAGGFPAWYSKLGWGYISEHVKIPINLLAFLLCAIVVCVIMHCTVVGKHIFAIGTNALTSEYTGVSVRKIKLVLYTINGLMASVTGIFLMGRLGSARPNVAQNYELDVIAMCVLGGVSTSGGKGSVPGVIISIFLLGFLQYGMNINNVPGQIVPMVTGILLLLVLVIPNISKAIRNKMKIQKM